VPERPGIVFISEDMDNWPHVDVADLIRKGVDLRTFQAGDLVCWTGRFRAHWESDEGRDFRNGPDDVSVEEAIAWGRSQADIVMVRVGNGDLGGDEDGYFSAGKRHPDSDTPVWRDGEIEVAARPYRGHWTVVADGYEIGGGGRIKD
jgi:hypothetical protein